MKATEVLSEEHRVIERVLNSMEIGVNRLERGLHVRPEFLFLAADFIKGFADGCHHQKEEGILFKEMAITGLSENGCPLGVMLAEHQLARQYTLAMRAAATGMQSGDANGVGMAIQSSRNYISLLRNHIFREDNILFPMADELIPADRHDSIWADFEKIEHEEVGEGIHEKYLAIADALENEFSSKVAA